jgi:broad specificity polyphosphatase/5'/3'-nucleotidase SurE
MPSGFRITKQGGMFFHDNFVHHEGVLYVQTGEILKDCGNDMSTDINTVRQGKISVCPLIASRTEMSVFEKLKNL